MNPCLDRLARVRREGVRRPDRISPGTLGLFGHQLRFDLGAGFPGSGSREKCPSVRRYAAGTQAFPANAVPAPKRARGRLHEHA